MINFAAAWAWISRTPTRLVTIGVLAGMAWVVLLLTAVAAFRALSAMCGVLP